MSNELHQDPLYPVYDVRVRWTYLPKKWEDRHEVQRLRDIENNKPRAPDGHVWNSTGWTDMRRTDIGITPLFDEVRRTWWPNYLEKNKGGSTCGTDKAANLDIRVTQKEPQSWCLSWFAHFTFDVGQSDEDVLASFERFLVGKGVRLRYGYDESRYHDPLDGDYCAMGAEDRWRWKGSTDGDPENICDPPCRCKGCKKKGRIVIGH